MRRAQTTCGLAVVVALLCGCSSTPESPEDRVGRGWSAFEDGDYESSRRLFEEAIPRLDDAGEAFVGLGWSQLRLDLLRDAIDNLTLALESGVASADPLAGQAIALRDLEPVDFNAAIDAAQEALSRAPRFVFSHDPTLDWKDLRLILAQAYFGLSLYEEANTQVDSLGGQVRDPGSDSFVADLLLEIQRLGTLITSP